VKFFVVEKKRGPLSINAFPNPSTDFETVIFDVLGRPIQRINGVNGVKINVSQLTKGIYFLQIQKETLRFIKV
jgi:hypothetical protein